MITNPLEWLNLKRLIVLSVGKDWGQSNLAYIPGRNENGHNHF